MSTRELIDGAVDEYGSSYKSDIFQFKVSGKWQFRLLTKPVAMATHFFGKGQPCVICFGSAKGCPFHRDTDDQPSLKFMAYAIVRGKEQTDEIQLVEFPWSVVGAIADFEEDEELGFENYPMPYDIRVTVNKESKDPKSVYKTIAGQKRTELTEDTLALFSEKLSKITPEDYVAKRKQKSMEKYASAKPDGGNGGVDYPDGPSADDIPF